MKTLPTPDERMAALEPIRRLKMARSAHAYVRGSTVSFYKWLEAGPKIPNGPPIWICGDCHMSNLGPISDADGNVEVQIRDLDQTVIGNPAHDIVRLALSLASAARGSDLPGVMTAHILEEMVKGYEYSLGAKTKRLEHSPEVVQNILRRAVRRRWHHLAEERIEDVKPSVPRGSRFWDLSADESAALGKLFESPEVRHLITSLRNRDAEDHVQLLDTAYWVKGCSSLGRLRYVALVGVGKKLRPKHFSLIDIKEATKAAAPRYAEGHMPVDDGERVVTGARALSPGFGERMLPIKMLGKSFVMRELLPQDIKLDIETLDRDEAASVARYLASVVGAAHGRQMNKAMKRKWLAELKGNRPKTLEAPSWLWTSVTELIASHEVAYLDHCRQYANTAA
jgi:uncharacterized protein (DUF2252 family)